MSILIFIVVIVVLIVVHEFGHLLAAKWTGMRVDEFGIGYPPRAAVIGKWKETIFTLNWLPFGGFVKIYGEDLPQEEEQQAGAVNRDPRSFAAKTRPAQALVLVAGVTMNLLLAYVLLTAALLVGTPRALSNDEISRAANLQLIVSNVLDDTPADEAGLMPGDVIVVAKNSKGDWRSSTSLGADAGGSASFSEFISVSEGEPTVLTVMRLGGEATLTAIPKAGLIERDPSRYALGVEVAPIGVVPLSFAESITHGARLTWGATLLTAEGLYHFFAGIATGTANWAQVAGPVGIAGAVGAASSEGFGNLLSLVAVISINLALINLIPVPALDGGRLLFVAIESVIRRPINAAVTRSLNALSFILLILLMVAVTASDIFKIIR